MTIARTKRTRLVSLLGLIMLLLSITPIGVAAQTGISLGGEIAQTDTAIGPAIELLVGQCPIDAPADPSDLVPGCLQDGMADVNVQVTSTNPALGIDQPKVTTRPQVPGPGVINTGAIPLGEYKVTIDLPVDENRFFFECKVRGTETAVPATVTPDGATNSFLVTTSGSEDIVCSALVTSTVVPPTIEITYRECDRAALQGDGRTFADLDPNCTAVSTDPPTFSVRDLNTAAQPVTEHQLDAEGKLLLTLTPGAFDLFTDLDMDEWGEYLFCEYEGQQQYVKDFDPTRGIVTFTDLLAGEEITCDWFAVSVAEAEAVSTATDEAQETAAASETPLVQTAQPQTTQLQAQVTGPTVTITYNECTRGDMPGEGRTFADLDTNCDSVPAMPPTMSLTAGGQAATRHPLDANGVVQINLGQGVNVLSTGLDVNQWGQYLFCEYEGQPQYPKTADSATGAFTFVDISDEQITCSWFAVNVSQTPTGEVAVPPLQPEVTPNGSIGLTLIACQSEESVGDTSSLDAFRANCTPGIENMVFNLANGAENTRTAVTLPTGEASFADLPAGDWQMWSEIPLEAATEYYFCADESGVYAAIQLSDRGVASFNDFNGQNVTCEIYVIPENLRGDVTGASVEVHLSACPIGYDGSSWYNDCHANGVSDQSFTLIGPSGELTSEAVVERTPGPGIAKFTALPAGEYTLLGGPPQDFGTVFLYCSDPTTSTQVETTFADGRGSFTLAENQSIICDWYFVPDDQGAPTPTPVPVVEKAEILTTMFICPQGVNVAGSTFSQLDGACAETLSDVPMTLQSPGGVPITANTGESGPGAIRFFDLLGGNYMLTPTLPAQYVSAAVYCDLDGGAVYQKALSNGATTYTNVDGELISCSWFVTAKPQPAQGPTGSITIREMLCEGDRATIVDWERECQPGASGVSFTITSSGGAVTQTLAPNDQGVAVFTGLPNEYFAVKQSEGAWCRAKAERVDAQSRVIVANGGNTDVFLYQCNQEIGLPNTGSGPAASDSSQLMGSYTLGAVSLPFFAMAAWHIRRWTLAANSSQPATAHTDIARTSAGFRYR